MIKEALLLRLLAAIAVVETGGSAHPDAAVGDKGRARGRYQIHSEVVSDVNRFYGTSYTWRYSCHGEEDARNIALKWFVMWEPVREKFPTCSTEEYFARAWNGGPYFNYVATNHYWEKVKTELNRARQLDSCDTIPAFKLDSLTLTPSKTYFTFLIDKKFQIK